MTKNYTPEFDQFTLDQFTTDLTSLAQEGKLDPEIGWDSEIEELVEILCSSENNNAVLIGDRSVGNTTIVEGLAYRIISRNIPDILINKQIRQLDLGSLTHKSQYPAFDQRLVRLIDLLSVSNCIAFISEPEFFVGQLPHSLIRPLKSAISQHRFLCIAEMTNQEFEKWRETNPVLSQGFQPILVDRGLGIEQV